MRNPFKGDSTRAKSIRSASMVLLGFGGTNVLRLISNLILTRILFPEAFGLMALMNIFIIGLNMFSDIGVNTSIIQNDRGSDPKFLNTAWTLQIIRGFILWGACCALAYPAAQLYEEPRIIELLPIMGLTVIITGFQTTKIALANRNLQLGAQTMTDLASQVLGLTITVTLAVIYQSVWSLVIGMLFSSAIKVISQHIILKGPSNRIEFDKSACSEIISFGKFIFISSIAGFLVNQGDRAILGAYISFTDLGVFSVGYLFANTPWQLAQAAGSKIIFPLYKKLPTTQSAENRQKVNKARRMVLLSITALIGLASLISVPMINFLYDERYHDAGPILALLGFALTTQVMASNYQGAHLSHGDSRRHMNQTLVKAFLQVTFSLILIAKFGTLGAILSMTLASLLSYPFVMALARRYKAWNATTDLMTLALGWGCSGLAVWLWRADVMAFISASLP
jgi:O-antigen/teichoic acid export membrane protein